MPFLDLFKKRRRKAERIEKKTPKRKVKKEPAKEPVEVKAEKETAEPAKPAAPVRKTSKAPKRKAADGILRAPQITEKATHLQSQNDYVFKVGAKATKPEIKKAIEQVYDVNVVKVRTINVPRKSKRLGRSRGFKSGYRKAIVRIKKGQSIEIMPR